MQYPRHSRRVSRKCCEATQQGSQPGGLSGWQDGLPNPTFSERGGAREGVGGWAGGGAGGRGFFFWGGGGGGEGRGAAPSLPAPSLPSPLQTKRWGVLDGKSV